MTTRKPTRRRKVPTVRKATRRTARQAIAAAGAAFLPVASYVIAHHEAPARPLMWALVVAALAFSAPTLAEWAEQWCRGRVKAWGFCVLLEGVMIFASSAPLSIAGLVVLVFINCTAAWTLAREVQR